MTLYRTRQGCLRQLQPIRSGRCPVGERPTVLARHPNWHPKPYQTVTCAVPEIVAERLWRFRAVPKSVPRARDVTRQVLAEWSLSAVADDAELVVGELVGNAVTHTEGPFRLRLAVYQDHTLACAVTDTSPHLPLQVKPSLDSETGRGLLLVSGLCERWGAQFADSKKTVWAFLKLPEAADHERERNTMTTMLGMPEVPTPRTPDREGPVTFAPDGHHFALAEGTALDTLVEHAAAPLSVILQVTKRCNFDCNFCSETLPQPDPTLKELENICINLSGVQRVFLSGGEPLLRRDLVDIVEMYGEFILGIPTNATRGVQFAKKLVGKVAFVNVGLEGPRSTTNRVRGDYDKVLSGIYAFMEYGLPLSLSCVVLRSTLHALPYTYQLADGFSAGKLKLILPLRKGNGLELPEHEFISLSEADQTFAELSKLRSVHDWRPALRMTAWTEGTEGHMILIEPTGETSAWPVYEAPDLLMPLGNLREEPISEIWKRYPYKRNHYAKYLGKSIRTLDSAGVRIA